jgi:hypothetical protein
VDSFAAAPKSVLDPGQAVCGAGVQIQEPGQRKIHVDDIFEGDILVRASQCREVFACPDCQLEAQQTDDLPACQEGGSKTLPEGFRSKLT